MMTKAFDELHYWGDTLHDEEVAFSGTEKGCEWVLTTAGVEGFVGVDALYLQL